MAVFSVGPEGARVIEMVDGLSLDELRALTGVPLTEGTLEDAR